MRVRMSGVLVSTALAWTAAAGAQAPSPPPDAREATRCAAHYAARAEIRAQASERPRLLGLAAGLRRIAAESGATPAQLADWSRADPAAPAAAAGAACDAFVARHSARLVDTRPQGGDPGRILARHANGRPAEISALGRAVRFGPEPGASCREAVLMPGAEPLTARSQAQAVWLEAVHPGATVLTRATRYSEPPSASNVETVRIYSWLSLRGRDGAALEACFDTSAAMRPALRALQRPGGK